MRHIKEEYLVDSNSIRDEEIISQLFVQLDSKPFFFPNKTQLLLANQSRQRISDLNSSCDEEEKEKDSCINIGKFDYIQNDLLRSLMLLINEDNAIGKMYLCMLSLDSDWRELKCNRDTYLDAFQSLSAIKRYHSEFNTYPDSLNEIELYLPSRDVNSPRVSLVYSKDDKTIKYSYYGEEEVIYLER